MNNHTTAHQPGEQPYRSLALVLRGRSGLTQRDLAALLGVSDRAIQNWEAGLSHPTGGHLKHLIALYLRRGVLTAGREAEEAAELWEALLRGAAQRVAPFDPAWFAVLPGPQQDTAAPEPHEGRLDWGEAPEATALVDRDEELATLSHWLLVERCRLVVLLGLGGIGKTALAARLAHDVTPAFEVVCWRSLRDALPVDEWLGEVIGTLDPSQTALPTVPGARLRLLIRLLRERRALLVLDNLETVLKAGEPAGQYLDGYAGYGEILRQLGESGHQSCLLVTGREAPPELGLLAGEATPVRLWRVEGLDVGAGRALLQDKDLAGDDAAWRELVDRYGGNPLALKLVGRVIADLFGSNIGQYLGYVAKTYGAVFGGLRRLLDEQITRLSPLEQTLLYWLAVEREAVRPEVLAADLGPAATRGELIESLEGLRRRSLLERGAQDKALTLQPAVLEYATERLIDSLAQEVTAQRPALLVSHAVVQATAKDYVRRTQERLIAQPLLERLAQAGRSEAEVERALLDLLGGWRDAPDAAQGYGPGNVVNLLRLQRGNLHNADLSHLAIRQAYLQGTEAQGARLTGTYLEKVVLADAFNYPTCVALCASGTHVAAGTATGEVRLWRVADRTVLLGVQIHARPVLAVALSRDGGLLASGSEDGTVRLWETASGRMLATLQAHSSPVLGLALAQGGRLLASGGEDGTVRLWEMPTGRLLGTVDGQSGAVLGVALAQDGRLLARGSTDGAVRLWELPTGQLLASLTGHAGPVDGIALSGDGRILASGSHDGTVRLWEVPSGRPLATFEWEGGGVQGVALSEDGELVAAGSFDGMVRLWTTSGRLLATLQGHRGGVSGVAMAADGRLVASSSHDGTVKLWETSSARLLATLQGHTSGVMDVALDEQGGLLATGSQDGVIRLWEPDRGQLVASLRGHAGPVTGIALCDDGRLLASGSLDSTVRLWDVAGRHQVASLKGHISGVVDVAMSRDGRIVASGSEDGTVRLWDAASGRALHILHGHTAMVHSVALSGDGRLAASGSYDGTVRLWDSPHGTQLRALRADRPYEGMDITGLTGVTQAQREALLALGAVDQERVQVPAPGPAPTDVPRATGEA